MANRKSIEQHRLRGTLRRDRTPKAAGARLTEAPKAPRGMSPAARNHWRALAALLVSRRTLTEADEPALALLCSTLGALEEATARLASEGFTIASRGSVKAHPLVAESARLRIAATALFVQFGMTPKSRSAVEPAPAAALPEAAHPDDLQGESIDQYLARRPQARPQ